MLNAGDHLSATPNDATSQSVDFAFNSNMNQDKPAQRVRNPLGGKNPQFDPKTKEHKPKPVKNKKGRQIELLAQNTKKKGSSPVAENSKKGNFYLDHFKYL